MTVVVAPWSGNRRWRGMMVLGLHLRCDRCRQHLAGPLAGAERTSKSLGFDDVAVGMDEVLLVREIPFPAGELFGFRCESDEDMLVHPQWFDGWRRDWPDLAGGAALRRLGAVARGTGCCGPQGTVECRCGSQVGLVMADCIGPQWLVFFDSRVERSDRHDGPWTIPSDGPTSDQWYEESGELINNRREGEWERWLVTRHLAESTRRGRDREVVRVEEDRLERRWVGTSLWAVGALLARIEESPTADEDGDRPGRADGGDAR